MYLVATGEPPFRDRQFDKCLAMHICEGLRPLMPDSTPEEYKKLAEWCCDADPDKHPDVLILWNDIQNLINEMERDLFKLETVIVSMMTAIAIGYMFISKML